MNYDIKCASFISGETIIFYFENELVKDAFFIKIVTDTESKERFFSFSPILKCKLKQDLTEKETANLMKNINIISVYTPEDSVKNAYKFFIENDENIGRVMYNNLYECGPSKEWVDKIHKELEEANAHLPKRQPISDGNIIKGAFGPYFEDILK
ncbi:hypothetical protein [Desulfomicrobium apsheronum]|nr:hypothetical protein [Desulfomicrobium apsheronum]